LVVILRLDKNNYLRFVASSPFSLFSKPGVNTVGRYGLPTLT